MFVLFSYMKFPFNLSIHALFISHLVQMCHNWIPMENLNKCIKILRLQLVQYKDGFLRMVFIHGRTSLEDDPYQGDPKPATTPAFIEKYRICHQKINSVSNILTEVLGFRKLWVQCQIADLNSAAVENNETKKSIKCNFLSNIQSHFERKETLDLVRQFITMDCLHGLVLWAWDMKGILFVNNWQTDKPINSECYCNLLDQLKDNKL